MATRNAKKDTIGFEQALERLEAIKAAMDSPDTELEQMIALYEEGLTLIRKSRQILTEAELRIQTLEMERQEPATPEQNESAHDDDEFTLL